MRRLLKRYLLNGTELALVILIPLLIGLSIMPLEPNIQRIPIHECSKLTIGQTIWTQASQDYWNYTRCQEILYFLNQGTGSTLKVI